MKALTKIAKAQPQVAYIAYTHGEQHRYTYFLRTIKDIAPIFKPLDDIMDNEFLPALFGHSNITPNEREILSLPVKEGGLGLRVVSNLADVSYITSTKIQQNLPR